MKVTLYKPPNMTDLDVVNMARVSFGKESDWDHRLAKGKPIGASYPLVLKPEDEKLIAFLARGCTSGDWDTIVHTMIDCDEGFKGEVDDLLHYVKRMPTHWAPFAHPQVTLRVKVPIFVARQLDKHQAGFVKSEISRRYITDKPEFYVPAEWRMAAKDVKQGSSSKVSEYNNDVIRDYSERCKSLVLDYQILVEDYEICPEQVRMVLPQSTYTEYLWTGSLYGWANMYNQRSDPHAQKETQEVARQVGEIISPLFPVSWKELTK